MSRRAVSYTVGELASRGPRDIPPELVTNTHLVYSSPAALAFNSPGAEGYGVKRAGLCVPGSVMLIVSPGCCGRNTSSISSLPGYEHRFFYLTMDETDLVTGRHLKRIPQAVRAVVEGLPQAPSVVMVCITCVDALLGTDMERVCRKAEEASGVRVRPCYMYALTREGRKPPMVNVRQTIYGLLEPAARRDTRSCNLMGFFAPVSERSDLRILLSQAGIAHVREVSSSGGWDEFQRMASANFNLVLEPEAAPAAADLERRLGMPWIELSRFYEVDRIARQYEALARVLGVTFDQEGLRARARDAMRTFRLAHPGEVFSVGECCNADPFELALALVRYGFGVAEVFGTVTRASFAYLGHLVELSPQTKVYSNLDPSMIHYDPAGTGVTVSVGRDAGYYHPECPNLAWCSDDQPFGYQAVADLFASLGELLGDGGTPAGMAHEDGRRISLADEHLAAMGDATSGFGARCEGEVPLRRATGQAPVRGFRRELTPFAPDQSGAVAALYGLGGMCVVVDAGGCVGNICGFDEPRWFEPGQRERIFSAGLRDMDAILGRDDALVDKVAAALGRSGIGARFVALVGTPVPAVIGTDLTALARLVERRCGVPAFAVECNGMRPYDVGAAEAYRAYLRRFAPENGVVGVLGALPLDVPYPWDVEEKCRGTFFHEGNLAVSPAGLEAARYLRRTTGAPYEVGFPQVERLLPRAGWQGRRVLVVHQQVLADAARHWLLGHGAAQATCASFFSQPDEVTRAGDLRLSEEGDLVQAVAGTRADVILADPVLQPLVPGFAGEFYALPHFALSGRLASMPGAEGAVA